jgi:cytochrome oxidase Cu insertion factor (SCO1/SenC/PrrC family)
VPGMSSGLPPANPTIVSAFQSALLHQALLVVGVIVLLALAWNLLRSLELRRSIASEEAEDGSLGNFAAGGVHGGLAFRAVSQRATPHEIWAESEPSGRRLLRIGFGLLWVFDGFLQGQASMPLGMTTSAIDPTTRASPQWVQHVVNFGVVIWNDHPVVAAVAIVWIQLGIGLWLLVAPRGRWSRAAGLVSITWALVIWVFGEAFGGLFAPGASWLFGAPGAAVFYCVGGALVALSDDSWANGRLGRGIVRTTGVFFLVMAGVQAWPGRGFWQGAASQDHAPGTLAAMVTNMAATPQPHVFSLWLTSFASFDSAHGFGVNLFVVVVLVVIGIGLLARAPEIAHWSVVAAVLICLADWVLVQDVGFFGGTGTDPNSMIPIAVLLAAGYVASTRTVVAVESEVLDPELQLAANLGPGFAAPRAAPRMPATKPPWRERVRTRPVYVFRVLAAVGAAAVVLLGATPMAIAALDPSADPIVSRAVDGPPVAIDAVAPAFHLVDQSGRPTTLASLHGKVIVLTFLDPVCVSDCLIIADELRQTASLLAKDAAEVDFVAVVANPLYRSLGAVQAFDKSEGLNRERNWLFLTGAEHSLSSVWHDYGIVVAIAPAGAMVVHNDFVFVIDTAGTERFILNADPGPGTAATQSSFASTVATTVRHVLASR